MQMTCFTDLSQMAVGSDYCTITPYHPLLKNDGLDLCPRDP